MLVGKDLAPAFMSHVGPSKHTQRRAGALPTHPDKKGVRLWSKGKENGREEVGKERQRRELWSGSRSAALRKSSDLRREAWQREASGEHGPERCWEAAAPRACSPGASHLFGLLLWG